MPEDLGRWSDDELACYCAEEPGDQDAWNEARDRWTKLTEHQMRWSSLRHLFGAEDEHVRETIDGLRAMADFLEAHPELVSYDYCLYAAEGPTPRTEERILALLDERDSSDDPCKTFGPHRIYVDRKETSLGVVDGLRQIAKETT